MESFASNTTVASTEATSLLTPFLNTTSFLYLFAGLLSSTYVLKTIWGSFKLPLPPGPKRYPIVGNALDFPKTKQPEVFSKWGDIYGDVVYLDVLGQPMVILGSQQAAVNLLDKKSSIYSDRPYLTFASELVGWTKGMGLMPYGNRLRESRKQIHSVIGAKNAERFVEMEEEEIKRFLKKLFDNPENFIDHIKWVIGSIILRLTYGYRVAESNDTDIANANRVMEEFARAVEPGAWVVDFIPILKYLPSWFPGAGFKRVAAQFKESGKDTTENPYNRFKARMESSDPIVETTFIGEVLASHQEVTKEMDDIVMWNAGNMFGGGSDTTLSVLTSFFLAMSHNPQVQRKAQAEVDSIIAPANSNQSPRLPTFRDKPNMPYIAALIKEILRWAPVGPVGLPHRLTKEDVIEEKGWRVPAGTIVFVNIWKITRNAAIYPDPDTFNPERFLGPNPQPDPTSVVFGYGRRICPGMGLAQQTLSIAIPCILALFDIAPKNGVLPKIAYTDSPITHPLPFECDVKPRAGRNQAILD